MNNLKLTAITAALLATAPMAARAADVSLIFSEGYLGTQGTSTNKANNIKTFSTLGILRAGFFQSDADSDGLFDNTGLQGNDIDGFVKLYLQNGTVLTFNASLNFRETTGSAVDAFGFITASGQDVTIASGNGQTYPFVSGTVASTSSSIVFKNFGSSITPVDGEDRTGNAATSGLLDALNAALLAAAKPSAITLTSATVTEGQNLVFTVTLDKATTSVRILPIAVTGTATVSSDYGTTFTYSNGVTNNGDRTLTVPVGVTSFTITVGTIADAQAEASETVVLSVSDKSATGNIRDTGCVADSECTSAQFCNGTTGVCTAKLSNGTAISNDSLHGGTCTLSNASAVCLSGQCNSITNTCGAPNGTDCSAASQCVANLCGSNGKCGQINGSGPCSAAIATVCQSGACSISNVCIPAGGCAVDGDCTGGLLCDVASFTCKDLTPPNTFIDSPVSAILPATNLTKSPTTTFEFSAGADTATATYECSLNGGAFVACPADHLVGPITDGVYTLSVRAVDAAGNKDPTPATYTWTVDLTPPNTFIDSAPASLTSSTSATFTFSSDTTGATYECSLDGGAFEPCPSTFTTGSLLDGTHTLAVRAKDPAGNVDPTPASYSWTVNTSVPDTTIATQPALFTTSTTGSFTFGSPTSPVTFECKLDGAADFTACPASFTTGLLAEGTHTLAVRAKNAAGTVDPTPATYTWTVDLTPPDTEIVSQPPAVSSNPEARFEFASNDPAATFQCSIDGGAFLPCPADATFPGLEDGPHSLLVRAVDAAGNVDPSPASYEWTVDTLTPDTILDSTPAALTSAPTATFEFSATEPGCTFQCSLDGGAFVACTSGFLTGALEDGVHTFAVRAIDPAGNVDPTPATWTWTVDSTPPDTTIDEKPAAITNDTDATFTFSSSDPTATFECSLDGATFAPCPAEHTINGLGDGPHTLLVRAKDAAGNVDPTPERYDWTVDLGVPDTTIDTAPASLTPVNEATFTFHASEPECTFECSIDGGAFGTCPATVTGLTDGPHTFAVRATDAAGNVDPTPATYSWVVDTTPPDTTIETKPTTFARSPNASFTFGSNDPAATYECAVDGGTFAPCPANLELTGLADGPHSIAVRAVDAAGNQDPTPATYAWTVDTSAPDTIIDTHPKTRTGKTGATFTFHATEPDATYACSLDGADFVPCSPGVEYTVDIGTHTFLVRATDLAGNTDTTPADWAWTVFADRDGDELADDIEEGMGTDPEDGDSDDDGVLDGDEPQGAFDTDGDGLINALDPDSDNDGLLDGTEMGVVTPAKDTNTDKGLFIADADPSTTTDPLDADTDNGGIIDGAEDINHDGKVDAGEADPNAEADEATQTDTDGDGLPDAYEEKLGTNPNDADSDDDGSLDGAEANPALDTDGDGKVNALDPDSDNDGLFDGTEQNVTEPNKDTDVAKGFFIADADPASKTSPLIADTDKGGVADGTEDFNHNGRLDAGERTPNDASDDNKVVDADGDGILDGDDNCPTTPNADQADMDGDRVGDVCDTDVDGDGFLDTISVSGGSCSSSGAPAVMALLGLVAGLRRRRR